MAVFTIQVLFARIFELSSGFARSVHCSRIGCLWSFVCALGVVGYGFLSHVGRWSFSTLGRVCFIDFYPTGFGSQFG